MGSHRLVTGALLLLMASLAVCWCSNNPTAYLPITNSLDDEEIDWTVGQIDSQRWGNSLASVASTLKEAENEASQRALGESFENKTGIMGFKRKDEKRDYLYWVIRHFANLARGNEEVLETEFTCTSGDVSFLTRTMNRKYGGVETLKKTMKATDSLTLSYLKHYANKYYSLCLDLVHDPSALVVRHLNQTAEFRMDRLIAMDRQYEEDEMENGRIAEAAKQIDPAKGRFNALALLNNSKALGYTENRKHWLKIVDSGRLIVDVLFYTCLDLYLIYTFPVYNMGKFLNPEKAANIPITRRFEKLNEYSRICDGLRNGDRDEIRKNVISNLVRDGLKYAFKRS